MEKKVEEYRNIQRRKWKTSLTSLPLPTPPTTTKPLLMMVYLNVLHYDLLQQFQQQQGEKKENYIKTKLENSIHPPPPNPWFHCPRFQ